MYYFQNQSPLLAIIFRLKYQQFFVIVKKNKLSRYYVRVRVLPIHLGKNIQSANLSCKFFITQPVKAEILLKIV